MTSKMDNTRYCVSHSLVKIKFKTFSMTSGMILDNITERLCFRNDFLQLVNHQVTDNQISWFS